MTKMRCGLMVIVAAVLWYPAGAPLAQPFPGGLPACLAELNHCRADLGTCTTTLDACTTDLGTCAADLTSCNASVAAAEQSAASCLADLNTCDTNLGTCTSDLTSCNATLAAATRFPATGQTTCWNGSGVAIPCAGTGQDGDTRAGATLSYTDNGDGTITDNNTKLVW